MKIVHTDPWVLDGSGAIVRANHVCQGKLTPETLDRRVYEEGRLDRHPRCRYPVRYKVDGVTYCKRHAAQRALDHVVAQGGKS